MADSYRTNQFYKINQRKTGGGKTVAGPGGLEQQGIFAENPTNEPFAFPGPTRYHLDENGVMQPTRVQRGFIRLLSPDKKDGAEQSLSLPNYRFFFQFNPQTIARDVRMSSSVYNPLLQTAEELATPIASENGFSFEMLIDRSFEMSGGQRANTLAKEDRTGDVLAQELPDNIGVLSDIRILDSIVGQGITAEFAEQAAYQAEIRYNVEVARAAEAGEDPPPEFDRGRLIQAYNANIGNQAFLIPNPVRVVFSSLFMVDGYVTQMKVDYVRFNANMVPITAKISVQMHALYIGFAKPRTVMTSILQRADPANNAPDSRYGLQTISQSDSLLAVRDLVSSNLKKLFLSFNYKQKTMAGIPIDKRVGLYSWMITHNKELDEIDDVNQAVAREKGFLGFNFPQVSDVANTGDVEEKKKDNDPIYNALSSEVITGIKIYNVQLQAIRRPFTDAENGAKKNIELLNVDFPTLLDTGADVSEDGTIGTPRTDNAQVWWEQTTCNDFRGSTDGERFSNVLNTAANRPSDDQLGLEPLIWNRFKVSSQLAFPNAKIYVGAVADMDISYVESSGNISTITLRYEGARICSYNDKLYVELELDTSGLFPPSTYSPGNPYAEFGDAPAFSDTPSTQPGIAPVSGSPAAQGPSGGVGGTYMRFDYPSTTWASPPISGPPFIWSNIQKVVIHYPGGGSVPSGSDPNAVKQYLNNQHNGYLNDPDRGYSLGYNAAVDKYGNTYGIRQDAYKCAANLPQNDTSFAILLLVDGNEGATAAQIAATKSLLGQCNRYAQKFLPITYHGGLSGAATACPGSGLIAQINAGDFNI